MISNHRSQPEEHLSDAIFHTIDRLDVAFDETQLVADAGLLLPATLAHHLGLREVVERHRDLGDKPGQPNRADKLLTLVMSALAGGDCIDDANALRAGGTGRILGFTLNAASTVGTFLRSFRWGHVRQLDRVMRELLGRAWAGRRRTGCGSLHDRSRLDDLRDIRSRKEGARGFAYTGARGYHPLLAVAAGTGEVLMARLRAGTAPSGRSAGHFLVETVGRVRAAGATGELTMRADSGFSARDVIVTCRRLAVRFSITTPLNPAVRRAIEAIPDEAWVSIAYPIAGGADVAEIAYTPFRSQPDPRPVRLIVRRVRPKPGSQLALFPSYDYHPFLTDREGDTLTLEADRRRHAEVENAIRDLKYGVGGSTTCPRAGSAPTPPGSPSRSSPTTSPAGRHGSGSASGSSRRRPCAAACSASSAGSPVRRGGSLFTCRPAGRGRSAGARRWPASARSH